MNRCISFLALFGLIASAFAQPGNSMSLCLTWLPSIPGPPRSSGGCVFTGSTIVYLAGHTNEFHFYPPENFTDQAHQIDIITYGQWDAFPNYPIKAQGFRAVAHDGKIYGFGGFVNHGQGDFPVGSVSDVYRYDQTNKWTKLPVSFPTPRSSYACSVIDSKVYFIGGWNGKARPPKPGAPPGTPWFSQGDFYTDIWVFDLNSEKFAETPIPFPGRVRRAFASAPYGKKIVCVGGLGEKGFGKADLLAEVILFDTATESFSALPNLPQPLFSPSAAIRGDVLYVGGGLYANGDLSDVYNLDTIQTLDLSKGVNGSWTPLSVKLRTARSFIEALNIPSQGIGFLGGHGEVLPVSDADLLEEYPSADKLGSVGKRLAGRKMTVSKVIRIGTTERTLPIRDIVQRLARGD